MRAVFAALLLATVAHAAVIVYDANLSGPAEGPPNTSPGTGFALVTIDTTANTMRVQVTFSGLVAGTTASHIHCCTPAPLTGTAGVATTTPTFPGFPLGVTSGSYDQTFDLTLASSYNPAFDGATPALQETTLLSGMAAGVTYLNVHSTTFPGGEIRGFLVPTPEPGTFALAGAMLIGFVMRKRRKV
jgi:hypothetical protein